MRGGKIKDSTRGGIFMGPTTNLHGCYKILVIATGQLISQEKFTVLPMTQSDIAKITKIENQ